jgi:hypothetical protein
VEEVNKKGFASNAIGMQHRSLRDRIRTFEAYGGLKCACCGEEEWCFLTLDHIEGGGNTERFAFFKNKYIAGHHMARELRLRGFPPGYQVLCMNCNFGRRMNGGICPHAKKPLDAHERLAEFEKLRIGGQRAQPRSNSEAIDAGRPRRKAQRKSSKNDESYSQSRNEINAT